ncbi:hypothetical protein [Paraburkholderia domus]|uniref:Uncharacterized protein n=1 Tax=Paraburkholderia domus TaxID=2793075 RepID=A0A9N8QVA1_9BURK|nr:hypothetical protein [Paraburkholderia domus]MBK5170061.1 hypothetical protein [Burkholderia sp. R-70211]CAE6871747.1 hypothetical protein R70211_01293 [Paraburkholderia domus]
MKDSLFVGAHADPTGPSAQPLSAVEIMVTLAGIPLAVLVVCGFVLAILVMIV